MYALRVGDNRPVIRISPTSDERYTPPEGQYIHYSEPVEPIETTYPVPTFVYDTRNLDADNVISQPIYRQFNFPSPLLIETPFKPTENSNGRYLYLDFSTTKILINTNISSFFFILFSCAELSNTSKCSYHTSD